MLTKYYIKFHTTKMAGWDLEDLCLRCAQSDLNSDLAILILKRAILHCAILPILWPVFGP
jgi:hypothetical protein